MFQYLELFLNNGRDITELSKWIDKNIKEDRESLEHICDYFMGIEKPNYSLSYKNALAKSNRWIESMRKDTTNEVEGVDYEVVYRTKDGLMKFVKLLTKDAYENESANMRHCIRSYWGNDREVFSLRDDINLPHATMDIVKGGDKIMQIQGKGDNTVDGKYQEYNIEFLQSMGFTINSDFIKKIGYKSVKSLVNVISNKYILGEFIKEDEEIQFRNGWRYGTFGELKDGANKIVIITDIFIKSNIEIKKDFIVTGSVAVYKNATFTAPKLTSTGSVAVYQNATFTAPKLTSTGSVYVYQNATFTAPKLEHITGCVDVYQNAKFTAPKLEHITGYVDVYKNATFTAPKLTSTGSVYVREKGKFIAPFGYRKAYSIE